MTRSIIFGHFTASAFVVNKERTKMVVIYHIINDGWIYPSGHADGAESLRIIKDKTIIVPIYGGPFLCSGPVAFVKKLKRRRQMKKNTIDFYK